MDNSKFVTMRDSTHLQEFQTTQKVRDIAAKWFETGIGLAGPHSRYLGNKHRLIYRLHSSGHYHETYIKFK